MENGRQGGWEGREGANVSGATGPPVWSRNRAQRRAVFGEVSAASPHENTPRRPRGEGGYGSTALTAHTPERGGRAERRREMVGSGSEGGCGEGWCPSPPSPPSTTGAAPPRGELLPPRCLCHLLSASAATAAATASDAAVGGWLLGKQWREGPTYRFPMAAAAVVGRRKGGGGDRFCPAETHTATADGMAGRPSARPCPRHLVPAHLPPGEHGQRGRVSTAVLTRPHPRGQPDGSRRRPRPARFPPREGHPRSRTAKRRQPGCFACPS